MSAPAQRHARVRAMLDHPTVRTALGDSAAALPDDAGRWLAQICLLEGVPFSTLVPDPALLPPESIRFFYVDQNWIDAMVDGALSIAGLGVDEHKAMGQARDHVQAAVRASAAVHRDRKRGVEVAEAVTDDPPPAALWTGILLRSAVVADFPGLKVMAFPDAAGNDTPLNPLRIERVAPGVLIAIFDGAAQRISVARPLETMHFGFEPPDDVNKNLGPGEAPFDWQSALRALGGSDDKGTAWPAGTQFPATFTGARLRPGTHGRQVVDIKQFAADVGTNLDNQYGSQPKVAPPPLLAGGLGIQLVASAERIFFVPTAIVAFDAQPHTIAPGGSATLSWQVRGADTCTIDSGVGAVDNHSGSVSVSPTQTTDYDLTATGPLFSATERITVTVE